MPRKQSIEIVKLLIAHGASTNCQNVLGNTPLHHAAKYGQVEIVKCLLASGADTNLCNNVLCTPLSSIVHSKHQNLKIIKLLIANLVKQECCNQNIDSTDKQIIDCCFAEIKHKCLQEVQSMQAIVVKDNLTLWDIFVVGHDKEEQKKYACMLDVTECPQYRLYIDKDIVRSAALNTALKSMSNIFDPCSSPEAQPHLPYLPPEMKLMILENLNNEELIKVSTTEQEEETVVAGASPLYEEG
ncbi:ankyrin repeat family protein [Orientia chuto str. Dubai]|uniref:Ankyrin repeat family protein n=1 Tax=Orientia chuto str. Dubai TaxID=1359168 RepID=A0A0F3MM67_9RICK|nr:ankyrin repeat domain-containing protein [Candidatus Orientia mediorientalis]KJV56547.1 ankyrin repeat family protein [Orientia chuto str. Dubai]